MERLALAAADWIVIGLYLALALAVGLLVREKASASKESYFLAGRSLPWWWAGLSIAATTFAADTPLAVTGIVARRGISGNWLWLCWVGVHAALVVYFAARWSRSGVLTDAELIGLRYDGPLAGFLRGTRALVFGVVFNCIILGWVLRAMVKISTPFFHWAEWTPGLVAAIAMVWPEGTALGSPSDGLTIIVLLAIVAFYSSLGGIRGVVITDLVQLGVAVGGSVWLAAAAWQQVGGGAGLSEGLVAIYGAEHQMLDLFPSADGGWIDGIGISAFAFGVYLLIQSYSNVAADGGGYLMQRINATPTDGDARKAAMLFLIIHYVVRTLPWFVVATVALVLIPIGGEATALDGAGAMVAGDREMAYPVLMAALLPPVVLGLVVTSLLAAFMSTVDTHLNWGASYMVNDVLLPLSPSAPTRTQLIVARVSVVGFALLAVFVSFHIDTIEQAWKWVAALGAALGVPTILRWLWWRVNAAGEIGAMAAGLIAAAVLALGTELPYELRLIGISGASGAGMLAGILLGPATASDRVAHFVATVQPLGVWPGRQLGPAVGEIARIAAQTLALAAGIIAVLAAGHQLLFAGSVAAALLLAAFGVASCIAGLASNR